MAVQDLPINLVLPPAPSANVLSYERGSQAYGIVAATGTVTQSGNAAPTGSTVTITTTANGISQAVQVATNNIWDIVAVTAYGDQPTEIMVQIDINLFSGTGSFSALTVNLLGSLDGVNFYSLGSFTTTTGSINPGLGVAGSRYLAFSVTTAAVASGSPNVSVSFTMGN